MRYMIARRENNRLRVLTLPVGARAEALPIFGTGRAAHDFLRRSGFSGGWRVRESTAGELISLLLGHLANVERVLLDPVPNLIGSNTRQESKRDFIAALMGEPLLIAAN